MLDSARARCYLAPMDSPMPATEITALLGKGTRFEGKLHFEGRVRIDGVFKGEIKSDDTLIIGEGAEVHAEIDVATVIVKGGIVHGNIRAKTSLELHAPGKLVGNINAIVEAIKSERPAGAKGTFIRSLTVSSTMGVGVRVLVKDAAEE